MRYSPLRLLSPVLRRHECGPASALSEAPLPELPGPASMQCCAPEPRRLWGIRGQRFWRSVDVSGLGTPGFGLGGQETKPDRFDHVFGAVPAFCFSASDSV